jgi:hypothetical protein
MNGYVQKAFPKEKKKLFTEENRDFANWKQHLCSITAKNILSLSQFYKANEQQPCAGVTSHVVLCCAAFAMVDGLEN